MKSGIGNKILSRYADKKSKIGNFGIFTAAYEKLGDNSAKLIIGSSSPLTADRVRAYVFDITSHKMLPSMDTMTITEDKRKGVFYASVFVHRSPVQLKPVNEVNLKSFTQINANSYLDESMSTVWSRVDKDGVPYFVRQNDEKVEDILEAAQKCTANVMRASARDFALKAQVGDHIEFFAMDENGLTGKGLGKVDKINTDKLDVTVGEGEEELKVSIPASAIIRVVPMAAASSIEEVIKYLEDAYPDAYKERLKELKQGR